MLNLKNPVRVFHHIAHAPRPSLLEARGLR
jgi:hypothetical protein